MSTSIPEITPDSLVFKSADGRLSDAAALLTGRLTATCPLPGFERFSARVEPILSTRTCAWQIHLEENCSPVNYAVAMTPGHVTIKIISLFHHEIDLARLARQPVSVAPDPNVSARYLRDTDNTVARFGPFGLIRVCFRLGEGLYHVAGSQGEGFVLSDRRQAEMPAALRLPGTGHYDDYEGWRVVLSFPEHFTRLEICEAREMPAAEASLCPPCDFPTPPARLAAFAAAE